MGTPYTAGFIRNCTCYPQILYLWLYGYSVHGYRYGVQKADLQYTREKPQQEMDSDDMEDEEYMKKGDLAAALVHSGGKICLSVIEVKESQFGTDKVSHVTVALDDLEDISKPIKVIGQIIALEPSTTKADFWEWT